MHKNPIRSVLIAGAGVAGAVTAWMLHRRGVQVALVDAGESRSASTTGAGILNPLSGKRLLPTDRDGIFLPAAKQFYREVEEETDTQVFHPFAITRELTSNAEWQEWEKRRTDPLISSFVEELPQSDSSREGHGSLRIQGGGRVDFAALVKACCSPVEKNQKKRICFQDLVELNDGVEWNGKHWDAAVLCRGAAERLDPCCNLDWNPAGGDILTIRLAGWDSSQIRIRDCFTVPLGGDAFLAGSNYFHENFSGDADEKRISLLLEKIKAWTDIDPELIKTSTGIRPALQRRFPVVCKADGRSQVFVFNGLGSKAALWAPWAAEQLVEYILGNTEPDQRLIPQAKPRRQRLTESAHSACKAFCFEGMIAVDATAGRGRDTAFLAKNCGATGSVFTFDIQPQAVASTRELLEKEKLIDCVTVALASHADFPTVLPSELHGRISVVMMSLGYLPGAETNRVTDATETIRFLDGILPWLAPKAAISVIAYRGQPGGREEHDAVAEWMKKNAASGWGLRRQSGENENSPEWFFLSREALSASSVSKKHPAEDNSKHPPV